MSMVPGPVFGIGEKLFTSAFPLISNWFVSAWYHIVDFRASSSSLVRWSAAWAQIFAGSTTWASQSKVGKSLVIGLNLWTGKVDLL